MTVVAVDGGDPPKTGSVVVNISVQDANDNNPQFDNSSYEVATCFADKTLRRQCRTFRRHIQLHKDRIADREDVGEGVGVVECGLYAIVCVGETSDIVGVTSCRRNKWRPRTTSCRTAGCCRWRPVR